MTGNEIVAELDIRILDLIAQLNEPIIGKGLVKALQYELQENVKLRFKLYVQSKYSI